MNERTLLNLLAPVAAAAAARAEAEAAHDAATEALWLEVCRARLAGAPVTVLARCAGVTRQTIYTVTAGEDDA